MCILLRSLVRPTELLHFPDATRYAGNALGLRHLVSDEQKNHSAHGQFHHWNVSWQTASVYLNSIHYNGTTTPLSRTDCTNRTMKHLVLTYLWLGNRDVL
jgi:hypothetical protein